MDELRDRKGELCDKVKAYFIEYKEKVQKHEEQLLQEILNWYNKQFELIKLAQKKEEQRVEKVCVCDSLHYGFMEMEKYSSQKSRQWKAGFTSCDKNVINIVHSANLFFKPACFYAKPSTL